MLLLNSTRGDKNDAYALLLDASNLGNVEAKLKVAWGLLIGTHLSQNICAAKAIFSELAEQGVPDAHMVIYYLLCSL